MSAVPFAMALPDRVPDRIARPALGETSWVGPLPATPWSTNDLSRLLWSLLLGAACILTAWVGASGSAVITQTIAWGGLAVGGLVVTMAGVTVWLLQAVRGVHLAQAAVFAAAAPHQAPAIRSVGRYVTGARMRHHHRDSCVLVRGKTVQAVVPSRSPELAPCPGCRP